MSAPPSSAPAPVPDTTDEQLERAFAPVWAGAWEVSRIFWVLAAIWMHLPKAFAISDAFAAPDIAYTSGLWHLADYVRYTPPTAWAIWSVGIVGIAAAGWGGKLFRPGVVLFMLCNWALLAEEALNVKAHDRLFVWVSLALLLSPAHERGLVGKYRSPAARWMLLVVFSAIYGSTGLLKLVHEPGWFDGSVLQLHLVHQHHGGGWLAAWVSGQRWLTLPMCWWTLIFECGFPFMVHWRRLNPWLLALGAGFHLGLFALMHVGPFALVCFTAYPVLLHPEVARGLWEQMSGFRHRAVTEEE